MRRTFCFLLLVAGLISACAGRSPTPARDGGTPAPVGPAPVDAVDILVLESFPVQVRVQVRGNLPDRCTLLAEPEIGREGNAFIVTLAMLRDERTPCEQAPVPYERSIPLDVVGLPAGVYTVLVNGIGKRFELTVDNVLLTPAPTSTPTPTVTAPVAAPLLPAEAQTAVGAAQAALAALLQVPLDRIAVVAIEEAEWPDACLGLAAPDEVCAQVIVPGYRIELQVDGRSYFYRTDRNGTAVRADTRPAVAAPTPTTACTNRAGFVRDVTVPDRTRIAPGTTFTKTWRLRNDGTCTWDSGYALVFDSGEAMQGPDRVPLTGTVPPGATVDLSVTLVAPLTRGTYQGFWKLQAADGTRFGLGRQGTEAFWVVIAVPTSATPAPASEGSSISGRVWHDMCSPGRPGETPPATPPPGCILTAAGTYQANGRYDAGEPAIAGMEVSLGAGPCPSTGLQTVLANAEGVYTFGGLAAGTYCVSIDVLSPYNRPIFIPGAWTYPPDGQGAQTVTVDGINPVTGIDFGWDYQFSP
jgi:hypothetical protein